MREICVAEITGCYPDGLGSMSAAYFGGLYGNFNMNVKIVQIK